MIEDMTIRKFARADVSILRRIGMTVVLRLGRGEGPDKFKQKYDKVAFTCPATALDRKPNLGESKRSPKGQSSRAARTNGVYSMRPLFVPLWAVLMIMACIPARAQQDCLSSLIIDSSKSVAFLSLDDGADKLATTMSCSAAESLRDEIFRSGKFDAKLFDDANQLKSKIKSGREQLTNANARLKAAKDRAAREAALKALKADLAATALVFATVGCAIKKSTKICAPALASLTALWESLSNLAPGNDLVATVRQASSDIDTAQTALQEWETALDQNITQQSKNKFNAMFVAMCSSIKQQCQKKP
ncbi:hypothetical protein [Bradyrhizobium japonicum]|uniref:hypothetical protein n=1 Tax=Bradyrhizobium japonicum TaxID=375 RepID=UPI0033976D92